MFKMGLHDPFGHSKHKLWPKEHLGIKLAIWLLTTKGWESARFSCVQVVCHISLESSQQGLQLCFKLHFNQRFVHKVMNVQSDESPKFRHFRTLTLESRDKMTFGCWPHGHAQKILFGLWRVLWICVYPWFVHATMCSNYAITNLLFDLHRDMWVIDLLVNLPSPHPRAPTRPSTLEVLWAREHTQLLFLSLSSPLDS
jgi:hypothetical protein